MELPAAAQQQIRDFVDDFLAELDRQGKSVHTARAYGSDLLRFVLWYERTEGPFHPGTVTPLDLREYRQHLLSRPDAAPATVNRRLATLRRYFDWAQAVGLNRENIAARLRGVEAVELAPRWLEKRELHALVRRVERGGSTRDLAIVLTLRHTGLRVSELVGLRLGDLELGARSGQLRVRQGKGGKHRAVPLNAEARRAIRDYLAVRPAALDDHLFLGQRGRALTASGAYAAIVEYARLAGLDGVTPHVLRHTFAKTALDAGANLVEVAALLGHKRLDTTARYTKPGRRDLERTVERLAE